MTQGQQGQLGAPSAAFTGYLLQRSRGQSHGELTANADADDQHLVHRRILERVAHRHGGGVETIIQLRHARGGQAFGRHLGWQVQAPKINITRVSAHVVNGEPIALVQEAGSTRWWNRPTPLPANVECLTAFAQVRPDHHKAVLWVTDAEVPDSLWADWAERLVVYRPPVGQAADATTA